MSIDCRNCSCPYAAWRWYVGTTNTETTAASHAAHYLCTAIECLIMRSRLLYDRQVIERAFKRLA